MEQKMLISLAEAFSELLLFLASICMSLCKTSIWNEKHWTRVRLQRPQNQDFYDFSGIKY